MTRACPSCGSESAEDFSFCPRCGAALGEAAAPRELRKTVSVVFCDVMGSTAIGERLDPEPLRRLMLRFYGEMKGVCEAHGGRVRELIGDAVMAAFGIPVVHEDDALRAVRAAVAMRGRLELLNDELERGFGVRLQSRTGINTGEVIVRDPDPSGALALGDAVNVAARLQGAAEPGEILLGEATWRLVGDAVRAEPVEPLSLKGKAEPVPAYRLLEIRPGAEAVLRHFETPLVGREDELLLLRKAFERAVRERRCHLVTVFGPAGIGKTRLARELARAVEGEARVLTGRCLSYGEGITYWPLREIVAQATGEGGLRELLEGSPDAGAVVARLEGAIGTGTGGALREEVFWAVRRLAEALADARPLLLVFEDIHWAEPTLLDLIDDLADGVRDVPALVVCLARPELLAERPGWGGGKLNAASVLLDPLTPEESGELIAALTATTTLPRDAQARVAAAAAGNPLFLEQMLAMISEGGDGGGELTVPPAIQGLLAARLDMLRRDERQLLEQASIEGEVFHVGGLVALSQPGAVSSLLEGLVHKELIRSERAQVLGEQAFRFRHVLIRDAAYEAVPKEIRSDLHERHANWLEQALGDRVGEAEEILGYHLEQAYEYRSELGPTDRKAFELADRARLRLASAGRAAFRRGDTKAAINLLERARALTAANDRAALELAPDLGFALFHAGEFERAEAVVGDAIGRAGSVGDHPAGLHCMIVRGLVRYFTNPEPLAKTLAAAEASLAVLRETGDDIALARAWWFLALLYTCTDAVAVRAAAEQAHEHARRAGSRPEEAWALIALGASLVDGPTPVGEAVALCDPLRQELGNDPLGQAYMRAFAACCAAMQGRFTDARRLISDSRAGMESLATDLHRATAELYGGAQPATLADDLEEAERAAREAVSHTVEVADSWVYAFALLRLARILCLQGRPDEALRILDESERRPSPPDLEIVVGRPAVRAFALAALGRLAEAEALARQAVGHADGTGFLNFHAEALAVLADVLHRQGCTPEAATALEEAIALYERKGNVVSAAKARAMLEELVP